MLISMIVSMVNILHVFISITAGGQAASQDTAVLCQFHQVQDFFLPKKTRAAHGWWWVWWKVGRWLRLWLLHFSPYYKEIKPFKSFRTFY